jgi:hypothetical protein
VEERPTKPPRLTQTSGPGFGEHPSTIVPESGDLVTVVQAASPGRSLRTFKARPARATSGHPSAPVAGSAAVKASRTTLQRRTGNHRPFRTVRSKIPSVARSADSGTIGKRFLRSPLTFDQS